MANSKEHIDKVFKVVRDIEPTPSDEVWEGIEKTLIKKNKPAGWLALKYAASFTGLLLLAISFLFSLKKLPAKDYAIASTSYKNIVKMYFDLSALETHQKSLKKPKFNTVAALKNSDQLNVLNKNNVEIKNQTANHTTKGSSSSGGLETSSQAKFFQALHQINTINQPDLISLKPLQLKDISKISANAKSSKNQLLDEFLTDEELINEELSSDAQLTNFSRFSITPGISPVFSGGNSGANISPQIDQAPEGTTNFSYGLQLAYKLNQKLSIRTGVHQINTGYQTNDLVMTYQSRPDALNAVSSQTNTSISFVESSVFNKQDLANARIPFEEASINQELSFVEIPVEAAYQVIDQKIGLNLIGGMSTLFLNQNTLNAQTQTENFSLGRATNVNSTSFTANLGFGLDYKFSKQLKFNIEPSLRYQINTFDSSTTNFKPYFIGVFSGIKFEF